MFSKALFKQSVKANGIMWLIITAAVCFMLACVMLISGGGKIGGIASGLEDTIMKSQLSASFKTTAINYYDLSYTAMEKFDGYFVAAYKAEIEQGSDETTALTAAYTTAATQLTEYVNALIAEQGYEADSLEAQEILGVVMFTLNPPSDEASEIDQMYQWWGEVSTTYDITDVSAIESDSRVDYRQQYCIRTASIFLAGNISSDSSVESLAEQLADYGITVEKYKNYGYDYQTVKSLAQEALVTYVALLENEVASIKTNDPAYAEKVQQAKTDIAGDLTAGFLSSLDEDIATALKEIGTMDLYNLIVGSIFYKMAGLLLPFIYVIMVSNSLIAGQVDSGSMAYVLSSSVKRNQVTFTQALFLVLSLLLMTVCEAATSCVCLAVVANQSELIRLTFGQLILMNFGFFGVLFAVSGICFFASCRFNRSKNSMAIGGGLTMFFLVATMLGLFGSTVLPSIVRLDALNFFNYVSIISLFDVESICAGTLDWLWKLAILFAVGIVCFVAGSRKFRRKDLPL